MTDKTSRQQRPFEHGKGVLPRPNLIGVEADDFTKSDRLTAGNQQPKMLKICPRR
jgi:hypothetical protein